MSVIQKIRDKYARWAVIAIAISLVGFLLMDAFGSGRTGLFGNSGPGNTLGKVNGTSIDRVEFAKDMETLVEQYRQQGYPVNEEHANVIALYESNVYDITIFVFKF